MTLQASYYAGQQYAPADMMQRENDWISPGVLSSSDLVVTQTATASMAVLVSGAAQGSVGGNAWLPGGYRVYNNSQATLTIAAANATNPRIDLVVACIDTSTSPYTPLLKVITGTPASSPSVPSIPSNLVALPLYQVEVAANVTSIVNANLTDVRVIANLINYFETAAGTATVITLTIPNLVDGVSKTFIASASNNSAATTINGKSLYKPNTTTAPNLISGKAYTVWYKAANTCFFIKASAEGNAGVGDVLAGKIFSNDTDIGLAGTMDLTNLTAENVKEDVNINGITGTLIERQDLYPGVANFPPANYAAVSYIEGEGIYCTNSAVPNNCYLFDTTGTLTKTISVSYSGYSLYPISITKNYILWTGKGTVGLLLSDKNGTIVKGTSSYFLNGIIDETNNKIYIEYSSSGDCYIRCLDFNLNNLGNQYVVDGNTRGIMLMSIGLLVMVINAENNNSTELYYVNVTNNINKRLSLGAYAFNLLGSI